MSDHHSPDRDAAPDPLDRAYARAEAMLDDETARAARRARVLGAVARDAQARPAAVSGPDKRLSWQRGGWLAAASVAGLSALVAVRLSLPADPPRSPQPAKPAVAAAPATGVTSPEATTRARDPASRPRRPIRDVPKQVETGPSRDAGAAAAAPPSVQAAAAPAPPPAPAAPASDDVSEVVVTSSRMASAPAAARAPSPAPAQMKASEPASPEPRAARLRAAAAAGRIVELTDLLARGAPVDAPDEDGETALMKAVRANRPAAAALLRRHGADPELKNRAGASARDMAASVGDAELDRALGLSP